MITRLRNTMVAHAWIKRESKSINQERKREIRTMTKKRMIKRRMRRRIR